MVPNKRQRSRLRAVRFGRRYVNIYDEQFQPCTEFKKKKQLCTDKNTILLIFFFFVDGREMTIWQQILKSLGLSISHDRIHVLREFDTFKTKNTYLVLPTDVGNFCFFFHYY